MRAARDRGIAAGEPFELDTRLRGKDGIYRWLLARYNPLVGAGRHRFQRCKTGPAEFGAILAYGARRLSISR
jgi:hypothetical protein